MDDELTPAKAAQEQPLRVVSDLTEMSDHLLRRRAGMGTGATRKAAQDELDKRELDQKVKTMNMASAKTRNLQTEPKANDVQTMIANHLRQRPGLQEISSQEPIMPHKYAMEALRQATQMIVDREGGKPTQLVRTTELQQVATNLAYWVARNQKGEIPIHKCIWLYGDVGSGKSTLAEAVHHVSTICPRLEDKPDRTLQWANLEDGLRRIKRGAKTDILGKYDRGHWVLDELRLEDIEILIFGQKHRPLPDLLYSRHEAWKYRNRLTIITSNISPQAITRDNALGDERLADRIRQQYHSICLTGINHRRKP